ncbi:MAG: DUF4136 domain-containing protein [Phycisphaerae bacterium]|nr:DUF4136 domain-containing protein [Phycisphaerae bacterium]
MNVRMPERSRNVLTAGGSIAGLLLLAFAATGCGEPMEVASRWGPGLRFSENTRTYAWAQGALRTTGAGRPVNPKGDELIRQLTEKHLALKGYEKAGGGTADFLIDYWAGKEVRGDSARTDGYTQFTEGTLAFFAYNPANSKEIWRGVLRTAMDSATPPERQVERLDQAIKMILDQVPSRQPGK